jgi:hypothetical protein
MCGACKRDVTEAARAAEREALRAAHGHVPGAEPAVETGPAGEELPAAETPPAPPEADPGAQA